jgi:hypothetical protein
MNNVVLWNENISLYQAKKDLTLKEYKLYLSSIKSMDASELDDLREKNDNLIRFLEGTHLAHDQYRTELIQLKEIVADLELDLEDERTESKRLREKLFSVEEAPEKLNGYDNEIKFAADTARLEEINQQLMIRLQRSEKKHTVSRELLIISKKKMLKQIRDLKFELGNKENSATNWTKSGEELPEKSGIYLLTDGIHQCVGYFNFDNAEFAKTTYFSIPTHWMARPNLPE